MAGDRSNDDAQCVGAALDAACEFDRILDRRQTGSVKWDRYEGRDVLPMWVADMDFRAPQVVIDALRRHVEQGVFGYTHPSADLVDAVRQTLAREYRWDIHPEWIVWLPGLVAGLNVACKAVGKAHDEVLTAVPVYPPFLSAPGHAARRIVTVPLARREGAWAFDIERLACAVTPNTRLFALCNPHNPVGRVYTRGELAAIGELCERHNLIVCADEVHCQLILDEGKVHVPFATIDPALASRTITLMAPSKTFNIPGLGCAFAVISDAALRSAFQAAADGIVPHVNALGYTAANAAYRHGHPWHQALLRYLRGNRAVVAEMLADMPGLEVSPIEATYLAWIDARGTGTENPVALFERFGVGLSDGAPFGSPGFVRLNFGCPRSRLIEGLTRMRRALGL
ncbi:MAG: PatB family C-S lyase [Betaproteobacteria bacterium]|nr:PatB family C-S lyase [Betaproteobacteria bacterium]